MNDAIGAISNSHTARTRQSLLAQSYAKNVPGQSAFSEPDKIK